MPIYRKDSRTGEVVATYVGQVHNVFTTEHRAMSDVYTIGTFAWVIMPDGSYQSVIVNSGMGYRDEGWVEVDASAEMLELLARQNAIYAAKKAELDALLAEEKVWNEANRPIKGKKMFVYKGKKKGHVGVCAFVDGDRVLLKPEEGWQDRKVDGIWFSAANMRNA